MNATLVLMVLGGVSIVAVVVYLRAQSQHAQGEAYLHFLCPGCRHRLRYQARQAGHRGKCSNCGHVLTFPPASQSID